MAPDVALNTTVELGVETLAGALRTIAHPRSEEELRVLFEDLRRSASESRHDGYSVHAAMLGRGSAVQWCAPTSWHRETESTVWISTESLVQSGATGIVEYVPGDGTLTAQAGAHIETLRAAVAEGGHRITPAGPRTGGTLGGLLACGTSGIDRCTFGPARHHVLGMRIQDASGSGPTRTGGRLVKNVTGYDLHRLHAGGRGTLGAILEASLRLMPIPESEVYVTSTAFPTMAAATGAALELRALRRVHPRALFVRDCTVHLLLGGRARQVDVELVAALEQLDSARTQRSDTGEALQWALEAAEHQAALIIATAPSKVADVLERLGSDGIVPDYVEPDAALIELSAVTLERSPEGAITGTLATLDPRQVHASIRGFHPNLAPLHAALLERHPVPAAHAAWTRRLQDSFDPSGILASPDFPIPASAPPTP